MMENQIDFLEAKTEELDILANEIVSSAKKFMTSYFYLKFVPNNDLLYKQQAC
jgi:hypothetical protein